MEIPCGKTFIESPTPIGSLYLSASESGLTHCVWRLPDSGCRIVGLPDSGSQNACILAKAIVELEEYFAGRRRVFNVPLDFAKATAFCKAVWGKLMEIPFGMTASYKDIAVETGNPHAARGVGQVCGKNPLNIFVPCHRVVSSSGCLHGYAGGLSAKQALLDLENPSLLI